MKLAKNIEANKLLSEFDKIDRALDKAEIVCKKTKYDFNRFLLSSKFIKEIYKYEITLNVAIEEQAALKELINELNDYGPRISKKIEKKNRVLESAKKLFDAKDDIIDLFEKGTFPYKGNVFKTNKQKIESEENKLKKLKDDYKNFSNKLRMNQKVLTMNCLKNIFIF